MMALGTMMLGMKTGHNDGVDLGTVTLGTMVLSTVMLGTMTGWI